MLLKKYEYIVIILQSVLRQVHSLFQREFSTECDPVGSLSICSTYRIVKVSQ